MEKGIEDLDFNEEDYGIAQEPSNPNGYVPDYESLEPEKPWMGDENQPQPADGTKPEPAAAQEPVQEDDIIISMLKQIGISDPSKIKFENDEGEIEEVSWDSLSAEEKMNILTPESPDPNYGLEEPEINFINLLRDAGITPEEYINYQREQAIEEYRQALEGNPQYEVERLTDEDLYALDLQSRVPDMTDEEVAIALEHEKANPELFEKKMQGIRAEYKALEDERRQNEELLEQQQKQEQFEAFQSDVLDAIESLDEVGGVKLNLDEDDMEEVANFILSLDSAGVSYLGKALDDPQTLARMAWFALKGDEAFATITDYYDKEIAKEKRSAYEAGYEDAKKGIQPKSTRKPAVVVAPKPASEPKPGGTNPHEKTIDDIDF
jgi:hypothetical protein